MLNPVRIEDGHVIVFGGSSGIGLGIARECLARGAGVTIASRSEARLAAAAGILGGGDRLATLRADVTDERSVQRALAGRPVDHVVLTAAEPSYGPIAALDWAAGRRTVESKLVAALHVAKHVRPPATGSLLVTSGVAAERPAPGGAVVAAVNGALDALVRALALELAPARVNALSPGWVETPFWDAFAGAAKAQRLADRARSLPVSRNGRPEDVAHAAVFLLENGFVTGTVLHVDGGHRFA
jgi:NAD(P)-dependent dehydrogenase (short-subunit alcohol dehydrogenase family)